MSYVEHCKKHGQYHGEICGECFEELQKAYYEQEEELDATMMAFQILQKENNRLEQELTQEIMRLRQALARIRNSSLQHEEPVSREIARAALEGK